MGIQINGQTDTVTATDGSINVGGDVTIPGILTYEDVTNVDSVGVITARDGIIVTGGSVGIGTTNAGSNALSVHGRTILGKVATDDATSKAEMVSKAALRIRPHVTNSGALNFAQVNNGSSIGVQYTNGSGTANWDIALQPYGGSVGIGTDDPGSNKLQVQGSSAFYGNGGASATWGDTSYLGALSFDGSAQPVIRAASSKALIFQVNQSTEALRITSDGKVLIGTDTAATNTELTIRAASPHLSLYATPGQDSRLNMGDTDDHDIGLITYANFDNSMRFTTNATERLRITSSGGVGIGTIAPTGNFEVHGNDGINISNSYRTGTNGVQWRLIPHNGGGSTTNLRLYEGAGATEVINITKTGRIGVNRMTPSFMLDIVGNSSTGANCIRIVDGAETGHGSHPAKIVAGGTYYQEMQMHSRRFAVHTYDGSNIAERFRVHQNGNIGINCNSPGSMLELNAAAGTKMGISLGAVGDNITASRYIGICKSADQTDLGVNSGFQGIEFGGPSSTNEGYIAFHTHDLGVESGERIRLTKDGKFGVGLTAPESKVQIRNTTTYGKDTYATANTGGSQTPPPGTFKWDNVTPVAGHGRGYEAYVQSGDAYPNASNYIDVLIRNAGFYRITLKRSHSSAEASVCQMMIYGLANSSNSNYPVVHMNGASGSGTSTATVQSGNGRGSSNAVASFYWEIHSYNVNTHDTIIRITTTGSNNQGIVALIEEI